MKSGHFKILAVIIAILGFLAGLFICIPIHNFLLLFGILIGSVIHAMLYYGIGVILEKLETAEISANIKKPDKPLTSPQTTMKHMEGLDLNPEILVKVYVSDERIAFVYGSYTKIIKVEDIVDVASGLKKNLEEIGFDESNLNENSYYFVIKYKGDDGALHFVALDVKGNGIVADTFKEKFKSIK